jgi:D-3-phosphoglycerate dehydrogenase
MKNGNWQSNIGETLHGQTLGIWGYGKIGRIIAGYGRAFGMNVQIWGGEKSREKALEDGFAVCAAKEALFETSDVLTVHLRLVPETAAIITGEDLARMKTSALFVNTSRAELVENGALETALKVGRPGFAALDVYYEEPLYDTESALLRLPNALCTPHLGYVEKNSYELYFRKAFENVLAFIAGEPKNLVNPGALKGK